MYQLLANYGRLIRNRRYFPLHAPLGIAGRMRPVRIGIPPMAGTEDRQ